MKPSTLVETNNLKNASPEYKLVVPDGGWGYTIAIGVVLIFGVTIVPMSGFGIVYNGFLGDVGDVTSGAAIANSIFNTALCFTGLAANQLLQKLSYRKVGLIGVSLYFAGSFGILFARSLFQLVVTFGILQGMGFGLLMPTILSTFNSYFEIRKDVIMNFAQAFLGILGIFVPVAFQFLMDKYGYKGTVAIICALSLHTLVAVVCIQPVKRHLKRRRLSFLKDEVKKDHQEILIEGVPLLKSDEKYDQPPKKEPNDLQKLPENIGSKKSALNIDKHEKEETFWSMLVKSLDLGLFKDPVYINIALGIALSITSDLAFLPLFPTLLVGNGFDSSEITIIMTTYFVADLITRLSLTFLYAVFPMRNRYVFLASVLSSAVFRIVFTMYNSFWWIVSVSAILGFARSPIQSILPLVIAEAYGKRFVTAFSLYMVLCGFVALGVGFLAATVKSYTHSDIMVMHLYSVVFLLCGIPWLIEVLYFKLFKKKEVLSKANL